MRVLKPIIFFLMFITINIHGINKEWLAKDKLNFLNLNQSVTKITTPSEFTNSLLNKDIRKNHSIGYGLSRMYIAQYGGYITQWITILSNGDKIIRIQLDISKRDYEYFQTVLESIDESEIKFSLESSEKDHSYSFVIYEDDLSLTQIKNTEIPVALDEKSQERYEFLTDPMIFFDYGLIGYYEGRVPDGRQRIEELLESNVDKKMDILTNIIYSNNPVGRVYAIEYLYKEGYEISAEHQKRIDEIINMQIPIESIDGCFAYIRYAKGILRKK